MQEQLAQAAKEHKKEAMLLNEINAGIMQLQNEI